jgi:hypothetical protein
MGRPGPGIDGSGENMKINILRVFFIPFGLAFLAGGPIAALGGDVSEYGVKAAFLYNFTKYIEWPPKVFAATNTPFIIGVSGDDLDKPVEGKTVGGRPIVLRRLGGFEEDQGAGIRKYRVLFTCCSEKGRLPGILAGLKGAPVLTVPGIGGLTAKGGMIMFGQEGSRIVLMANRAAGEKAGLKISSKLLKVAKISGGE